MGDMISSALHARLIEAVGPVRVGDETDLTAAVSPLMGAMNQHGVDGSSDSRVTRKRKIYQVLQVCFFRLIWPSLHIFLPFLSVI